MLPLELLFFHSVRIRKLFYKHGPSKVDSISKIVSTLVQVVVRVKWAYNSCNVKFISL
ncbi:hypothetical protein Hanom_Chr17g01591651 [Helianthus anomalus]